MILCKCPSCGKAYKVKDEMGGRSAKCPCGNRFVIPRPEEAVAAEGESPKAPESVNQVAPAPVEQAAPQATPVAPEPPQAPEPAIPEPVVQAAPVVPEAPKAPEPVMPAAPSVAAPKPAFQAFKAPTMSEVKAPAPAGGPAIQGARLPSFAQAAKGGSAAPKAVVDDGYGGIGRGLFVIVLVGAVGIEMLLLYWGKNSGSMVKHGLAGGWGLLSIVGLFIVAQMRLINMGANEWLALVWPILIGWCSVFPEGFKDKDQDKDKGKDKAAEENKDNTDPPAKSSPLMLNVAAIAVVIVFYGILGGFAYHLFYGM
jgi:hypothetical protein